MNRGVYFIKIDGLIFLLNHVKDVSLVKELDRVLLQGADEQGERLAVLFSKNQIETLLDELSALFCSIGIETDYEPNKIGHYIEGIIDVFSDYKN